MRIYLRVNSTPFNNVNVAIRLRTSRCTYIAECLSFHFGDLIGPHPEVFPHPMKVISLNFQIFKIILTCAPGVLKFNTGFT